MATGYHVPEPSGRTMTIVADTYDQIRERVGAMLVKWEGYCERNWLNDSGEMFSPESKVKRFLDSLAYFLLRGNMQDIETEYKRVMHAKREIPASSCPSFVENILYAAGGTTEQIDQEERAGFDVMISELDERAEKYETPKVKRSYPESGFHKRNRLGIHGGQWCRVDTDGVFSYNGAMYRIDSGAAQYQPVETEFGQLYDMDRILAVGSPPDRFYDMDYNEVIVHKL